jgi:tetratricopeptide (TPR) repeat protein
MRANRIIQTGVIMGLAIAASCPAQAKPTDESPRQTAIMLEQQGKNAESETAWRAVAKAHPANPEPYAHLGLLEARQEHYKEAVPLYRKALALNPAFPALRLNLGLALFKAGETKDALEQFNFLLKKASPSSPEVQRLRILIGMAHYGLGEFNEAVPYLKTAAANDPGNLGLRLSLAHSCMWTKKYQCVMDTYHEILLLNAESAEADMLAGEALDELKDHDGAIKQFRAAVQANPKEPDVHFGLGYLLWTQRQYPEAATEFQAELANNPDQTQAFTYLGDAQMRMDHPEAALPLLEKVEQTDPAIFLVHLDLGILFTDAGRQQDALRELNVAAKLRPDEVDPHWRLGRLYRAMGKKDEAKAEFDKASSITKAADDALIDKISGPQARGGVAAGTAKTPASK